MVEDDMSDHPEGEVIAVDTLALVLGVGPNFISSNGVRVRVTIPLYIERRNAFYCAPLLDLTRIT